MSGPERLARVREIFERLVALPVAERERVLDQAAADDPSIRDEVLELLRLDDQSSSPGVDTALGLDVREGSGAAWLADRLDLGEPAEPLPETIGPFRVLRLLGQGSMGMVYEAEQADPQRRVAVKVMYRGVLAPGAVRRFQREARVLASLRHPGIVALHEVGACSAAPGSPPRPYLVMELVDGPTLRSLVREPSLSVEQRLELVAMLCEAVHAAHQRGVVHRDLKPENIVLTPAPAEVRRSAHHPGVQPKILDFGVSRLLEHEGPLDGRTIAGEVVGTVPYLSPEQARGEPADTRADVYALGVIAFELLSGRWPFDVSGLSPGAGIRTILGASPLRLRNVAPGLHPDVHTIVHKAIDADPAQRYSSAAEMGRDLMRFLAHEPIAARPPSVGYIAARFVRRHRTLTGVALGALTLLMGSLIVMAALWADARRTRQAAVWESYRSLLGAASVDLAAGDVASARRALETAPAEHRGWEHRHLMSRLDQSRRVFSLDLGPAVSLVPESDTVAVAVSPGGLRRIDLRTGEPTPEQPDARLRLYYGARAATFPRHMPVTPGVVAVPAAAGGVREIVVPGWPDWPGHTVIDASLSGDGRMLAVLIGAREHELVVVDLVSGASRVAGLPPGLRIMQLALSPDGTRLALATATGEPAQRRVRLLDAARLSVLADVPGPERGVFALRYSADGRRLLMALQDGSLEAWSVDADAPAPALRTPHDHDAPMGLSLTADGTRIAAGARDGVVWVFDAHTLGLLSAQRGHERDVVDVAFLPGAGPERPGDAIVSSARDGRVRVWGVTPSDPRPLPLEGHTALVHGLALAPRAGRVYTGSWDRSVAMYDAATGARLAVAGTEGMVIDLALSPDERIVVTREFGGLVRVWDAQTLAPLETLPERGISIDQPAVDASAQRIVVNARPAERTIRVWDRRAAEMRTLPWAALREFSAAWISPAAGLVALSEPRPAGRTAVLYDLNTGLERGAFINERTAAESITFAPDGRTLATFTPDNAIALHDTRTLERIGALIGHPREVLAMVFSPDGRRAFSADLTGVIRVWDVPTRSEVAQLRGHRAHLRRLIISPDGRSIISGSRDGTARIWTAPDDAATSGPSPSVAGAATVPPAPPAGGG